MGIAAGQLDRRVTLERATTGDDGLQDSITSWSALATVWAKRDEISDGERGRAQGATATATTRFTIRFSSQVSDLSPRDRLTCQGQVFEITGVKEVGRREGLEITAARRADL